MKHLFARIACLSTLGALPIIASNSAQAEQPHMDAALRNLLAARAELEKGSGNKGGERLAAISAINRAITEARAGEEVHAENAVGGVHPRKNRR